MRNVRFAFGLPALGAAFILTAALAGGETPDAVYLELLNKAAKGDLSIDFRALRLACAKATNCDANGDRNDVIAMRRATQSHDYEKAVQVAEKLIHAGFPNIEAHAICAAACDALKQSDKAEFHHEITSALIRHR